MGKLAVTGGQPVRTKPWPGWPFSDEEEVRALAEVARSNRWWRGAYSTGELSRGISGRSKVEEFEEAFARHHRARYAVAVSSGLAALDIALKAAGIGPGDEVIVPAYTFVASATCVLHVNAIPVFADVREDTYNLDPVKVEQAVTERTRAVIPVHFGGTLADMDAINAIATRHDLKVIEDAAHAHGVEWNGRMAGTFGHMGAFSFQSSKNMTSGEGGILITDNEEYADLAYSLHHYGRTKTGLWYEIFRLGWNFRMTEFQAAVLLVQLKRLDAQNAVRKANAEYLSRGLKGIPGITLLATDPRQTRHSVHLFMFRYDREAFGGLPREKFIEAMTAEGIPCLGGYTFPLYDNPLFVNQNFHKDRCPAECSRYAPKVDYTSYRGKCPVAERACYEEAVWLEHRLFLSSREDMDDIVRAVCKVRESQSELC